MAALATERDTPTRAGDLIDAHVAADVKIFAGALVMRNDSGFTAPGATATGCRGLGRAEETVDNLGGADDAKRCPVRRGLFRFDNDDGDPVGPDSIGEDCFIVDDHTVAATDGTGTRSPAGKVRDIDALGVWVEF